MNDTRKRVFGSGCAALIVTAMVGPVLAKPKETDPLAGPKVHEPAASDAPTLVERSFDGKLKRYDERIEEAAANKLDLADSERSAVRKVLDDRAAHMDAIVRENIELLVKGVSVQQSGDRAAQRGHLAEVREAFGALAQRAALLNELASVLPPEKAATLRAVVQEYWRERLHEEAFSLRRERVRDMEGDAPLKDAEDEDGTSGAGDTPGAPASDDRRSSTGSARILARLFVEEFGREVKRSYERIAEEGRKRLDEVVSKLNLTPEQEGRVRQLATEYAQQSKLNPNGAQKTTFFVSIMKELTPEQRKAFVRLAREGR